MWFLASVFLFFIDFLSFFNFQAMTGLSLVPGFLCCRLSRLLSLWDYFPSSFKPAEGSAHDSIYSTENWNHPRQAGKKKMWASVWDFSLTGLKTFQYSYKDIQLLVHEGYQMEKVLREATYKCSMVPCCCLRIKHYLITAQGNWVIWYS